MMETNGITMKARGAIRVLASLALVGFLLTWTGQRPVEAETPLACHVFGDWVEQDPWWTFPFNRDDKYHWSGTQEPEEGDWVLRQIVLAGGWNHQNKFEGWTMETPEHNLCWWPS